MNRDVASIVIVRVSIKRNRFSNTERDARIPSIVIIRVSIKRSRFPNTKRNRRISFRSPNKDFIGI